MGSSHDDEYSVTYVATMLSWYIPCVIFNRGGFSERVYGGCKMWVLAWVCGKGFCGYGFVKGVLLGYLDGIFLGRLKGCEIMVSDGVSWEILNGP